MIRHEQSSSADSDQARIKNGGSAALRGSESEWSKALDLIMRESQGSRYENSSV
jgi:hypothetical protein